MVILYCQSFLYAQSALSCETGQRTEVDWVLVLELVELRWLSAHSPVALNGLTEPEVQVLQFWTGHRLMQ